MCHVYPDVELFHLDRKSDIFMIIASPVLSDLLFLTVAWMWTHEMQQSCVTNGWWDKVKRTFGVFLWRLCIFSLRAAHPFRRIRCDLTFWADGGVTPACDSQVPLPVCPVSLSTHWLKPLTSYVRLFLWASLFICLFQTLLPFPFLLPLCIPWTLSSCFVLCVVMSDCFLLILFFKPAPAFFFSYFFLLIMALVHSCLKTSLFFQLLYVTVTLSVSLLKPLFFPWS